MKQKIVIVLIFLLAFLLRFVLLGDFPISLHRDEVYFGYNAYSLLMTGKDMSGDFLPLHFRSFLYSPGGYSYLTIPFILLFELNAFSVRFASALFGSATVIVFYFFVMELFRGNKRRFSISLLGAFFLAISPWHINLSRTATENTIVTFFVILGVYLLLLYSRKKSLLLLITSFLSFSVTLALYQAPRAFLPLFIPVISIILLGKDMLKRRTVLIMVALFALLIVLPVIAILNSEHLSLRIRSLNVFNHPETTLVINEQITTDGSLGLPIMVTRVFHNKITNYSLLLAENYMKHFSFDYLFLDKAFPDRYRVPKMGLLYIFELPLIILAAVAMYMRERKRFLLIASFIVLVPVGSALTFDDIPNLQRTVIAAPAFALLSGYGLVTFLEYIKLKWRRYYKPVVVLCILAVTYALCYYLVQYYFTARVYRPWYRNDGYKELVEKVNAHLPHFERAVITNRETAPSVMFLFFSKYDPEKFQNESRNADLDNSDSIGFSKFTFIEHECPVRYELEKDGTTTLVGERNILYVNSGACKDLPSEAEIIDTINRVDGSKAFYIIHIK